jgi:proline iminopeptidase
MNSDGFVEIAKEISALNYQTIIYDQRGTGNSKIGILDSSNITMELMAEDIENLRKKLNINKWTIFGHSFGGLLATYYTSKYPNSIDKIIFSSSGGVNLNFLNYVSQRINANLTKNEQDSLAYFEEAPIPESERIIKRAEILSNAYVYDKSKAPIIAKRLTQLNLKVNSLVFQDLQKIKYDFTNKFQNCKIPVLVIQGKNDIISIETAKEISDSFGNSKLILIDNCGHYGWLDNSKFYFESIKNFMKSNE